jgi:L-ascorbate metabolism protein UlaG (beta-lactamase superfamily)
MRIRSKVRSGQIGFLLFILVMVSMDAMAQPQNAAHDDFSSDNGDIRVRQVQQMSVVIEAPSGVIYTDPTGGKSRYDGQPAPDVILVSHEHHEHYEADTLKALGSSHTRLVVPPFVMDQLPSQLRAKATSLANGMSSTFGAIRVTAVPAYGLTGASAQWHPKGRGNGYIVSIDGRRIYVAGSSDAVPEMRELQNIDIAFLPLYPPYALGVDDAIDAVSSFRPKATYIYQYNSICTRDQFIEKMNINNPSGTRIIARDIRTCATLSFFCSN